LIVKKMHNKWNWHAKIGIFFYFFALLRPQI